MSKSSITALKIQVATGQLNSNKALLMDYIKRATENGRGVDMISLEDTFTLKQSTITSVVSQLEDDGLIYSFGTREKMNTKGCNYTYSLFRFY